MVEEKKDDRIAIQITVTRSFDEGQGTTWGTTVPQESSLEDINAVMDKIWSAMSRQSRWSRIERIDNEIEHLVKQMAQLTYSLKALEDKHPDVSKASTDVRTAVTQTRENLIRQTTLIDGLRVEQVRMRAELK